MLLFRDEGSCSLSNFRVKSNHWARVKLGELENISHLWAVWVQLFPSAPETDPDLVFHPGVRMAGAVSKKPFLKVHNSKCAESG